MNSQRYSWDQASGSFRVAWSSAALMGRPARMASWMVMRDFQKICDFRFAIGVPNPASNLFPRF